MVKKIAEIAVGFLLIAAITAGIASASYFGCGRELIDGHERWEEKIRRENPREIAVSDEQKKDILIDKLGYTLVRIDESHIANSSTIWHLEKREARK